MTERADGIRVRRPLRVGVINLMPRLETYEPSLRRLFAASGEDVAFVGIRLATHGYSSSDPAHLSANYVGYDAALATAPLDGLVLTGAPVETLPLRDVRYWSELSEVLDHARHACASTLGICWGAIALAEREGLKKSIYSRKVFGLFRHDVAGDARRSLDLGSRSFHCPQSRFAGFSSREALASHEDGRVRLLAEGGDAGPTLLASVDGRVVMHLGHPEYDLSRLGYEWRRDEAAGRTDVDPPEGYDLANDRPVVDWQQDSASFMAAWLRRVREPQPDAG